MAPLAPWFDRIRHAFLIGEATELFAGQLEGKLAYSRCGDLKSALDAAHQRAQREAPTGRPRRPAVAGLRLVGPVEELRAPRRCVPRHGARPAGGREFGEGSVIQVPRDDRSVIGQWWWTVDRWSLGAVLAIMAFGVLLTLAASPPAAERIGADSFLFAKRQFVFLPIGADDDAGHFAGLAAPCPAPGAYRVLRQRAVAGRDVRHRCRDQGRAALDLRARPVERAAFGVREAQPGGDLGLVAGAEPHRAPGAGLYPLHPAGRRRAGAADHAARPRHEHRGRPGVGGSALRRRPADVGRGLRRGGRRGLDRRRLFHVQSRAQPFRPLPRSLLGRQLSGQYVARSLHERLDGSAAARAKGR